MNFQNQILLCITVFAVALFDMIGYAQEIIIVEKMDFSFVPLSLIV